MKLHEYNEMMSYVLRRRPMSMGGRPSLVDQDKFYDHIDNTIKDEALSALSSLGISKNIVEKHINDILDRNNDISLEDLIKEVLKRS